MPNRPNRGGRKRTIASIEGEVLNPKLRRSKDRRWLLTFDLIPDDPRLSTFACAFRGDRAQQYADVLNEGAHVRVNGSARAVLYLNARGIESASEPRRFRCRKAG